MADVATKQRTYRRAFAVLVLVNTATIAAVYSLLSTNNGIGNLIAVTYLAGVIVAQTVRCGPSLTILTWVTSIPIAVTLAFLIAIYPVLDWSGPGEADEMYFAPAVPVIIVFYAIGIAMIVGIIFVAVTALQKRHQRNPSM